MTTEQDKAHGFNEPEPHVPQYPPAVTGEPPTTPGDYAELVKRLRARLDVAPGHDTDCKKAADAIEALSAKVEGWKEASDRSSRLRESDAKLTIELQGKLADAPGDGWRDIASAPGGERNVSEDGWRDAESVLADEILSELKRARAKFPGKNVTFAALVEEVGELATAIFEESRDRVRKEATQVAVMAMRVVLDGDHCFDHWRAEKNLDPLLPASPRNGGE